MGKRLARLVGTGVLIGALTSWAPAAHAEAIFDAEVLYSYTDAVSVDAGDPATSWDYTISTSNPGNGDTCLADNTAVPSDVGIFDSTLFEVLSLDPPFSGSSSSTRYLTVCKGDGYVVVEMTITLSDCFVWICKGSWTYSIVAQAGTPTYPGDNGASTYDVVKDSVWPDQISVYVPYDVE